MVVLSPLLARAGQLAIVCALLGCALLCAGVFSGRDTRVNTYSKHQKALHYLIFIFKEKHEHLLKT
jgi:hypothetical protein